MTLTYIGDGFLPGVPARNLTEAEVETFGGAPALLASGLYAEAGGPEALEAAPAPKKAAKSADKEVSDGRG